MKIAVVILNWNGKALLQKFLPDVIRYSPADFSDIYLIDNDSTDDSVNYIKKNFSTVKIIQNKFNGGYSKGYNEGLKEIKADIFCLLNSDIEVTQKWLEPVYQHFINHSETAIVQPRILDYKNKSYFEYAGAAGGFIDKMGYPYCRGRIFDTLEKDEGQYNDVYDIFWASGACFFIRSEVFWKLGALDEDYFAHQEEIDLCWRAFNANFKAKYIGDSTVYHVGGASLNHADCKKTFLNFRNSLFNLLKNAPQNVLWLIFQRLVLDGIASLQFLIKGRPLHSWAVLKAHFSFYNYFFKMLKKRRKNTFRRKDYYTIKNIVFSYFLLKRKYFKELH